MDVGVGVLVGDLIHFLIHLHLKKSLDMPVLDFWQDLYIY